MPENTDTPVEAPVYEIRQAPPVRINWKRIAKLSAITTVLVGVGFVLGTRTNGSDEKDDNETKSVEVEFPAN